MTDPKWTRARVLLFTLATIAIALFAHARPALAGGFFLYEIGTPTWVWPAPATLHGPRMPRRCSPIPPG